MASLELPVNSEDEFNLDDIMNKTDIDRIPELLLHHDPASEYSREGTRR